jgi:hypothetical protein
MVRGVRWLIGLATVGLLAGAALAWAADDRGSAGLLIRVGFVFAALWLAYPSFVRLDRRAIALAALGVLVVVFRPRSAIVVLPVIAWFARTPRTFSGTPTGEP